MSLGNTNTSPAAKILVPCPKCYGGKVFHNWSHIAGGKCFCCAGNGDVEISRAKQFGYVAPAAPSGNVKNIDLGGPIGPVSIDKYAGGFRAMWDRVEDGVVVGGGLVLFDVVAGEVVIAELSQGPKTRGEGEFIRAALQSALKKA
jgi:hypothetical protein